MLINSCLKKTKFACEFQVSDAIRGSDTTPRAHFDALVNAFYIPNVILVISAILFIAAAVFFIRDKRKFQQQMGIYSLAYQHCVVDAFFNILDVRRRVSLKRIYNF